MTASDFDVSTSGNVTRRRELNNVSVLLPCRRYRLTCSWTREEPLPALEEQACRLLMIIGGTTGRELQEYFGLSKREREVLIRTLEEKRLVETDDSGDLVGSALLQAKSHSPDDGEAPSLTRYETREEEPVFDMLALTLMPKRRYHGAKFGLPEVTSKAQTGEEGIESVKDAFSRQYRLHLENTVSSRREVESTRLYKIGDARRGSLVQVPIDMEFNADFGEKGQLSITRDAVERVGEIRKRGLSNEIETEIADFLGTLAVPGTDQKFEDFCHEVGDEVLRRYARGHDFGLNEWIKDRERRKTGYGSPLTEAMIGPVYLDKNRAEILDRLRRLEHEVDGRSGSVCEPYALWMMADVPLWAANGTQLETFVDRVETRIERLSSSSGQIVGLFPVTQTFSAGDLKRKFHARVPNGWGLEGKYIPDRTEIFLIPDVLAVAQYHVQPNANSAFTYPVGHLTTDPERIRHLSAVLHARVSTASNRKLLWSGYGRYEIADEDLGGEWLSGDTVSPSATENSGNGVPSTNGGRPDNVSGTPVLWKKRKRGGDNGKN